jgi:hypothetical protein
MTNIDEFELQVKLTGLCMFGIRPSTKSIIVVMPDTRFERDAAGAEIPMKHLDRTEAVPHVGYLRFNLANLVPPIGNVPPTNVTAAPPYEVVHRFSREELVFEMEADGEDITNHELRLPDFDDFAPVMEPVPGVFFDTNNQAPPNVVLMRTVLTGGHIGSVADGEKWVMTGELDPDHEPRVRSFNGDIQWVRKVRGKQLTLTIRSFDGSADPVSITLRPISIGGAIPSIPLKIANLCSTNPMEWDELELRRVQSDDVDFKWFYNLVRLSPNESAVTFRTSTVPHPHPLLTSEAKEGILSDCFPSRIGLRP